jgi:Flp pilus assembly protein TadG
MEKTLKILITSRQSGQRGATIVLVAVLLVVIVGFAALAIDLSHLFLVSNELHNAADAGALAGARVLYNDDGSINTGANQEAYDAATANKAATPGGALAVDVNWTSGNTGDVQRGHWRFNPDGVGGEFTPSDSLTPINLAVYSTEDLNNMDGVNFTDTDNTNPVFINAVWVKARRENTPAASFFARLFGYQNFALSKEAVAYIGFAGTLRPTDLDQPIGICKQAITDDDGNITCNTGRMFNSGGGTTTNTAAWTNFSQPCQTASASSMTPLICGSGNPDTVNLGVEMGTVGGVQASVYKPLRDCWLAAPVLKDWRGYPRERWTQILPVIDCPGNNVGPCSDVIGAVAVDFVWVKESGADPQWTDIPVQFEDWECSNWVAAGQPQPANSNNLLDATQRQQCWQEFASNFNLETADGTSVGDLTPSDLQRTMYFLPSCEPQEPAGITGGVNFGILAEVPVLVQ